MDLFSKLHRTELKLKETGNLLDQERNKTLDLECNLRQNREQSKKRIEAYKQELDLSRQLLKEEIEKRKKTESDLKDSHVRLTNLSIHKEKVKEEERKRIAREIHDELGSVLTALKMDIDWIAGCLSKGEQAIRQKTDIMSDLVVKTIHTVQRISRDLRPRMLDDLGLAAAIEWQAEEFSRRTGIACGLYLEPDEPYHLSADFNTSVFRITQELLTNVARHSQATRVVIKLTFSPKKLELLVQDDGIGITTKHINGSDSFGLIGIRERLHPYNGCLKIDGQPGKGTEIKVQLPLAQMNGNG
jgi:signal transduction histidine kinase